MEILTARSIRLLHRSAPTRFRLPILRVTIAAMKPRCLLCLVLLFLAVGCATETRSFNLAVKNDTAQSISMWTVKEHGPPEDGWLSPEQIAVIPNGPSDDKLPREIIKPGQAAVNRIPIKGEFDKESGEAYVRIYEGVPTLNQMLAMDKGSLNRLDIRIQPGNNSFVIEDDNGIMRAKEAPLPKQWTQPQK